MATLNELAARESERQRAAQNRLRSRIIKSEEEQNSVLTEMVKRTIIDKLVPPKNLKFRQSGGNVLVSFGTKDDDYEIHRHALGQIADNVGFPRSYLWRLHDVNVNEELWRRFLLTYNLNELYDGTPFLDRSGKPKRFLVRTVNRQVRGFLSQNYNRKLLTAPLLRTFIETCRQYGAGPTEISATDVRVRIKYMLPIVFEPVDNEYISFGVTFGNSDFGAGRLSIAGSVLRITTGNTSVLSDEYSRTHLGRVLKDEDLDDKWVSEDTSDKELETLKGYIRDKVTSILSPENVEKTLKVIQVASEKKIPWHQIKERFKELLTKAEVDMLELMLSGQGSALTVDLPPLQKSEDTDKMEATAWWAATAVGILAEDKEPDLKAELQSAAGKLIAG